MKFLDAVKQIPDRRHFIGGSDARIIMGDDEARLVRLWQEKRGEVEPEDLSGKLIVQLGTVTEELNRRWYERNTGQTIKHVQRRMQHPVHKWMAATLDGVVDPGGAVFEAKFMLPWTFSEEAAAEKHAAQLQHNMWVTASRSAVLSIITGGGKWVVMTISADPLYQHLLLTAERKFWRCVETGERPHIFGIEPPRPRVEAIRTVDMSSSNAWAEFANLYRLTKSAALDHDRAKTELKALVPEDAKEASGHGVRAKRSKSGALSFDLLVRRLIVQQSSTSVGALAAALAKAQAAIANPEKSLTATIISPFPREGSRTFRYASLSTGLDLVRKCLGQQEIAIVQATSIDRDSSLISLTTTLVHASGEWVSSDWPVASVSETATPHRLGAALTYARRYALFTLVGIAGEDDLDAPDLLSGDVASVATEPSTSAIHSEFPEIGARTPRSVARPARSKQPRPPPLSTNDSDGLRRQLVSELERLADSEALAKWAHRVLPLKNRLSAKDAEVVERLFSTKLSQFEASDVLPKAHGVDDDTDEAAPFGTAERQVIVISKPVRERDRNHLRFVASQPCLLCGRTPSDAHHIKYAEARAMGRKVSDKFTVPVCRLHHRELHRRGDERAWWKAQGIDPLTTAANLWGRTRTITTPSSDTTREHKRSGNRNGSRFDSGSKSRKSQNNETKPILSPEAE